MSNNRQGDYNHEIEARLKARTDAQLLSVSCAFCPWSAQGSAGELLEAGREHRFRAHGIKRSRLHKPTRGLRSIRSFELTQDERDEIAVEIAKRRKLLGIEEAA